MWQSFQSKFVISAVNSKLSPHLSTVSDYSSYSKDFTSLYLITINIYVAGSIVNADIRPIY